MNEPQPTKSAAPPASPAQPIPPIAIKRRRRWAWWLSSVLILVVAGVLAMPSIASIPAVRDWCFKLLSAKANLQISAKELSLSWFSPIVVGDISVQNDDSRQAVLSVKRIEGDTALWRVLFGHDAGTFRVIGPQLNIEFDKQGWNLAQLLQVMGRAALMNKRAMKWEIVDGSFSLRGPSSTRPWTVEKLNLQGTTVPASDNPLGVPVLHGKAVRLLDQSELTPQLCNDLLKFIAPMLSQTTTASGRVSLELDDFSWPLGKPESAEVKGKLTLHSVEVGPGGFVKMFTELMQLKTVPTALEIAKDDVVPFQLRNGRVYHENLAFSLSALQDKPTIRSHGSVGLDETLDLYLDISSLGAALPAESILRGVLSQVTLHFVGTLTSPKLAAPTLSALSDWLGRRRVEKSEDSTRHGPLLNRRNASENPPQPPASQP